MTVKKIKAGNVEHDIAAKYDGNEQEISNTYMTKANPTGTGSLSLNRKADTTIGNYSIATGYNTTASAIASHAEGYKTTASGDYSHTEGNDTTASGSGAHAEGNHTTASGGKSHAEGDYSEATGYCSHAEGNTVYSSGHASHAEGYYTDASSDYQHVQGKFNIIDTSNAYAHIVGNGESATDPSNAHTLDWDGNAWFSGDVYIKSTSGTNKDDGSKKLATEEFVNNKTNIIIREW